MTALLSRTRGYILCITSQNFEAGINTHRVNFFTTTAAEDMGVWLAASSGVFRAGPHDTFSIFLASTASLRQIHPTGSTKRVHLI
jgi:hypothetical protein